MAMEDLMERLIGAVNQLAEITLRQKREPILIVMASDEIDGRSISRAALAFRKAWVAATRGAGDCPACGTTLGPDADAARAEDEEI
jgi:hypothetical protein